MPRYHFFLNIEGRLLEDWSGRILPDLRTAILLARQEFPRLSRLVYLDNQASLKIEIRNETFEVVEVIAAAEDDANEACA